MKCLSFFQYQFAGKEPSKFNDCSRNNRMYKYALFVTNNMTVEVVTNFVISLLNLSMHSHEKLFFS